MWEQNTSSCYGWVVGQGCVSPEPPSFRYTTSALLILSPKLLGSGSASSEYLVHRLCPANCFKRNGIHSIRELALSFFTLIFCMCALVWISESNLGDCSLLPLYTRTQTQVSSFFTTEPSHGPTMRQYWHIENRKDSLWRSKQGHED